MKQNVKHLCITAMFFLHTPQPRARHLGLFTQINYHPYQALVTRLRALVARLDGGTGQKLSAGMV